MIRLRKECPEIGWGSWKALATRSPFILALCYSWRGNAVVIIHNFSARPQEARFTVDADGGECLVNLLEEETIRAGKDGQHKVSLEAHGYRWYRVGGLGYALTRQRDSDAGVNW
jgi:maltose alpha-D-glucosyltransferase/alpha-amylase